ncbi:MAG: 30S ribosomal protein S12 methylthiotransferase RimO [Oscillospiraceae bacterium]|nr:30S ribosomal protein S12 methylthiotransferase RimO [Oscillospiraceae bacterium]
MAKIGVVSLGCSKNQIDCEHMLSILDEKGYELTTELNDVDAVVINTCGFIGDARDEAYEYIREAVTLKEEGGVKKIVVTGCLSELMRERLYEEFPEIDALCGCGSYLEIGEIMEKVFSGEKAESFLPPSEAPLECGRVLTTAHYTAFIKIAEGCSNRCAYCVIPRLRGKLRSRDADEIVKEAEALCETGVRELIVVAQDTGSYGLDLERKSMLSDLLRRLCRIEKLSWIRVHYLYPDKIDDELIETLASEDKIVKYLDIPIQHINDRILKLMNRRDTKENIQALIKKLREKIPGVVIRTSLIVGFPGETDEEFEELCDFLKEYKIERAGVFVYSREEGTPAYDMEDQVDEDVKLRRAELVGALQGRVMDEYNASMIGKKLTVLVEGFDKYSECYFGRSFADSPEIDGKVFFRAKPGLRPGMFVEVDIDDELDGDLLGEVK